MGVPTGNYFAAPGPQFVYVKLRNQSTPLFLGTAVTAVEFEHDPAFISVFNDLAGRSKEMIRVYDGESALISCTLNRLDAEVCRLVRDSTQRNGYNTMGIDGPLERGSIVTGVSDFELIVYNTFFGTVNAVPGLTAGRKYYSCTLVGYKESAAGTRVNEHAFVFEANSLWLGHQVGFSLYTESALDFGQLTPN